jgi:hypothetical protein
MEQRAIFLRISISRGQPVLAKFTIHTKIIFARYFSTREREIAPTHTLVNVLFPSTFITPYRRNNILSLVLFNLCTQDIMYHIKFVEQPVRQHKKS